MEKYILLFPQEILKYLIATQGGSMSSEMFFKPFEACREAKMWSCLRQIASDSLPDDSGLPLIFCNQICIPQVIAIPQRQWMQQPAL